MATTGTILIDWRIRGEVYVETEMTDSMNRGKLAWNMRRAIIAAKRFLKTRSTLAKTSVCAHTVLCKLVYILWVIPVRAGTKFLKKDDVSLCRSLMKANACT